MKAKRKSHNSTFYKFDKVNGRSYKTVRSQPSIGPSPSVSLYYGTPKPAEDLKLQAREMQSQVQQVDVYDDVHLDESVDSDALESWEASMMRGFMSAG